MDDSRLDFQNVDTTAANEPPATAEPLAARKRGGRWVLKAGVALFLAIVAVTAWFQWPVDPLPQSDEITAMEVWQFDRTTGRPMPNFRVPRQHHPHIRSALAPTRIDRHPPNCKGMGALTIKTRDGREVGIALFSSDYSIGNNYYHYPRGGYGSVGQAIDAAREDIAREQP